MEKLEEKINEHDRKALSSGKMLPIMEEFYSIQGEGFNVGKAAYFIRIGGCDVGCHWCDVKESWDPTVHPLVETNKVIANVASFPAQSVVITGGEPLMYPLDHLTQQLAQNGVSVFLETSGAYPLTGVWHWICLSPKKNAPPLKEVYHRADELKVIVYNKNDFEWAEQHAKEVGSECKLYLQPEWSSAKKMLPQIINYVMENPKWNISLQTHKFMQIP